MKSPYMHHLKGIAKESLFMFIVFVIIKVILDQNEGKELFNGNPLKFFSMAILMATVGGIGLYFINKWIKSDDR